MSTDATPASTSAVVDSLVELTFAVHAVLTRVAAEHELSVTQLRLLAILRDRSPAMAAIAQHLGLDRSSVTGLIDRAERRGLVARRRSPDDARVTLVELTEVGLELAGRLAAAVTVGLDALLAPVPTPDRAQLARLARQLVADPPALRSR